MLTSDEQRQILELWRKAIDGIGGITASIVPDPSGNPVERLQLDFNPGPATRAADIATRLAQGEPPVIVRDELLDLNMFELDPCNLHPGEAEVVDDRLRDALAAPAANGRDLAEMKRHAHAKRVAWPD